MWRRDRTTPQHATQPPTKNRITKKERGQDILLQEEVRTLPQAEAWEWMWVVLANSPGTRHRRSEVDIYSGDVESVLSAP